MEKLRAKRIMCLIFVAILILATAPFAFAYPSYKNIGVPNVSQENTNWCWAACSVSALAYNGVSVSQSDFVETVKGSIVNQTASMDEIQDGLTEYGMSSTRIYTRLSYSDIIYQMNTIQKPAIAGLNNILNIAHVVELCGYSIEPDDNYVLFMNPSPGCVIMYKDSIFDLVCVETAYNIH